MSWQHTGTVAQSAAVVPSVYFSQHGTFPPALPARTCLASDYRESSRRMVSQVRVPVEGPRELERKQGMAPDEGRGKYGGWE